MTAKPSEHVLDPHRLAREINGELSQRYQFHFGAVRGGLGSGPGQVRWRRQQVRLSNEVVNGLIDNLLKTYFDLAKVVDEAGVRRRVTTELVADVRRALAGGMVLNALHTILAWEAEEAAADARAE